MELDDEGGRTFLRVLIHLIMQDYPPLVSGSLQLIFKHFSQRAEVLQAFKQVGGGVRVMVEANQIRFHFCSSKSQPKLSKGALLIEQV